MGSGLSGIGKIIKRDGTPVSFDRGKISFAILQAAVAVGGHDRAVAEAITDQVVVQLAQRNFKNTYPTVEEVQDLVEKCLIENGHAKTAKAYILYRYEHALKRVGKCSLTYSSGNIPYKKLWQTLSWAVDHDCLHLAQISRYAADNRLAQLIDACEAYYAAELQRAVAGILGRRGELKIVIVAGPSSSGKTTTCLKLRQQLAGHGLKLLSLNLDNYFFDLDYHPRDGYGDFDFESPHALDLKLINEHINRLLAGGTVEVPFYDFKRGRRHGSAGSLRLGRGELILIDSLHGMYGELLSGVDDESKFNLYIETLSQVKDAEGKYLRWSDIRMLRRMVRDQQFRNYNPEETILHWHYVRRSELRYIVSRLQAAHEIVNSFLPYELLYLKNRLAGYFPALLEKYHDDPGRQDACERAARLSKMFGELTGSCGEALVPACSLLREFIGGSCYHY